METFQSGIVFKKTLYAASDEFVNIDVRHPKVRRSFLINMSIYRPFALVFMVAAGCALTWANTCSPSIVDIPPSGGLSLPYTGTGCFNNDANEQSFLFTLSSTTDVSMFTTSWA